MKRWFAGLSATFVMALSGLGGFVIEPNYSQGNSSDDKYPKLDFISFKCSLHPENKTPTTFLHFWNLAKNERRMAIISWKSEAFSDSGWTPIRRCKEVSQRLDALLKRNGGLDFSLKLFKLNNQNVVCGVNSGDSNEFCTNLLFTLPNNVSLDSINFIDTIISEGVAPTPISDSTIDANGVVRLKDGREFVCLSRGANGNCSGILITRGIEL